MKFSELNEKKIIKNKDEELNWLNYNVPILLKETKKIKQYLIESEILLNNFDLINMRISLKNIIKIADNILFYIKNEEYK